MTSHEEVTIDLDALHKAINKWDGNMMLNNDWMRPMLQAARAYLALKRTPAAVRDADAPLGAIHNGQEFINRVEGQNYTDADENNLSDDPNWTELQLCFRHLCDHALQSPPVTDIQNVPYSDGTPSREWDEHPPCECDMTAAYMAGVERGKSLKRDPEGLVRALRRIEKWHGEFPPAILHDGTPCSYGTAYGSNGERDYMRGIAREVLIAHEKDKEE